MITKIHLENFKSVKKRQILELKPITLLFGPNSAGKSTVIQALHYIREILETENINADKTITGGDIIDLGGFRNLVHNHDLSLSIIIRVEAKINQIDDAFINDNIPYYNYYTKIEEELYFEKESPLLDYNYFDRLEREYIRRVYREPESLFIEMKISWSKKINIPFIEYYKTGFDNEDIGIISPLLSWDGTYNLKPFRKNGHFSYGISYINYNHSIFKRLKFKFKKNEKEDISKELYNWILSWSGRNVDSPSNNNLYENLYYSGDKCLPPWGKMIEIAKHQLKDNKNIDLDDYNIDWFIPEFLSAIFTGPGEYILNNLRNINFIGPLRSIPPRISSILNKKSSSWYDGMEAWSKILDMYSVNIEYLNEWLKRMGTYYEIDVIDLSKKVVNNGRARAKRENDFSALASIFESKQVVIRDTDKKIILTPRDVGVGISQVIPVLVATVNNEDYVLVVEQPELHLHPKMQMVLADMFIFQTNRWANNMFIIETHSEHLILRLLRRIEETKEPINWEKIEKLSKSNQIDEMLKIKPEKVSVNWFEPTKEGLNIINIPINEDGEFTREWPHGFFEERVEELFR